MSAVFGVIMYVSFIFVALFLGYSMGSAPIVSFHYGAGNQDELPGPASAGACTIIRQHERGPDPSRASSLAKPLCHDLRLL